jgi:uncharacterized YigZ family protein
MLTRYLTLSAPTTGEYKEKGSKFLAFAFPVDNEEEIKEHQDELRKEYYDARHHCYAYIIGLDEQAYRANDDGEPNHSAGDPILGQIRSHELTNCLVVVVRYFGGTKLGVAGLVNAYKTAAAEALGKIVQRELIITSLIQLQFGYDQLGIVERWFEELQMEVLSRDFLTDCTVQAKIPAEYVELLTDRMVEFPLITLKILD